MKPTAFGKDTPYRLGNHAALGFDPAPDTEDPGDPTDRASADAGGRAYVPFVNPTAGDVSIVQTKQSATYTATFNTTPTPGNKILVHVSKSDSPGAVMDPSTGLTAIGSLIRARADTGGVARLAYRDVQSGDSTGPYGVVLEGTGSYQTTIVEVSGIPAGAPLNTAGINDQTGTTVEQAITPTGAVAAWLYGGFASRLRSKFGGTPTFTPNGDTTVIGSLVVNTEMENSIAQPFYGESAGGAVTLGGTQGGTTADSSYRYGILVAAFETTAAGVVAVDAPLTIDDTDATYEYASEESIDAAGWLWRGALTDAYLIGSIDLRLAIETAGANTVTIQGANEADFSDATTVATLNFTATGSFTAQDLSASWVPTAVYTYWQLLLTTTSDVNVHEVSLYGYQQSNVDEHVTDPTDAHDASAISFAPAGTIAGTNVQTAVAEVATDAAAALAAQVLDDHADVNAPSPSDDDVLTWDSGTSRWIAQAPTGGAVALDDLTDVDTTGVADNDVLAYDLGTTTWVPVTPGSPTIDWGETADIVTQDYDDAADAGVLDEAARADHRHGMPSAGAGSGKYDPDGTPATSPAVSDEFADGSLDGAWAWDSTPATVDEATYPGWLYVDGDTTERHLNRAWSPGASDLTVAAKLTWAETPGGEASEGLGIYVGDATGNPANTVLLQLESDGAFVAYNENGAGSFSQLFTSVVGFGQLLRNTFYLRLTRTVSGPTWRFYVSRDGLVWYESNTTGSKSLTVAALGIRADTAGPWAVDWIRAWASIVHKVGS